MKVDRVPKNILWTFWLIAFICFQPASHLLQAQNPLESYTLANGVPVYYVQDTSRPLVEVALSVRGGARIDHPGADGLAALWARTFWERGEDSLRYSTYGKTRGIRTGARQGLSHSQFYLRMLPHRLPTALNLLRFGLEDSDYSGADLELALRSFALDLQQREGDPISFLDQELGQALWQDRYAEMNPFGYYPDLVNPNPKTFRSIHQVYLHPSNSFLSATGPLSPELFFHLSDSILGVWTNYSPQPYLPYTALPKLPGPDYQVFINELTQVPHLKFTWPLDGSFRDKDIVNLAEWFIELAQSRKGPFFQDLIQGDLASSYQWEYTPTRGPGQLSLHLVPNLDSLPKCLATIFTCFEKMMQANPDWFNEVDHVTRGIEMQLARQTDQPQNQLFYISRLWAIGLASEKQAWEQVPVEQDLVDFIDQYLFRQPHVAGLLLNSKMARGKDYESLFLPPDNIIVASEPIVEVTPPLEDTLDSIVVVPPPSYTWLEEIKIYFNASSFDPDSLSLIGLERVSNLMLEVDSIRLFVNGYADGQGDGVYNYLLSINRSESVKQVLGNRFGIPGERLIVRGFGEAFAEYPDDTPEHRAKNRRVTFTLVPKDFVPDEF